MNKLKLQPLFGRFLLHRPAATTLRGRLQPICAEPGLEVAHPMLAVLMLLLAARAAAACTELPTPLVPVTLPGARPTLESEAAKLVAVARTVAVDGAVTLLTNSAGEPRGYGAHCLQSLQDVGVRNTVILNFGKPFTLVHSDWALTPPVVTVEFMPHCDQPDVRRRLGCARLNYARELVRAGIHVFQSDMDISFLSNPFPYFFASSADVQSMSDGMLPEQVYGYPVFRVTQRGDAILNPAAKPPGQLEFHVNEMNIGCIFFRANERTMRLLQLATTILANTTVWDQMVVSHLMISSALQGRLSFAVLDPWRFTNTGFYVNNQFNAPPVLLHSSHHSDKLKMLRLVHERNFTETMEMTAAQDPYVFDFNESPYALKI